MHVYVYALIYAQHVWHDELAKTCCMQSYYAYTCTQERHHKVIRRHVVDRLNTTNLEQGLAEDLCIETLQDLRAQPLRDGFVDPRPASTNMVSTLVAALGCSGEGVMTCIRARVSGAVTLHRGDVAVYTFDGVDILAGDILFFASSREWGECAFISAWVKIAGNKPGYLKYRITEDLVRVPIRNLCAAAAAFIGAESATVICPPILNYL